MSKLNHVPGKFSHWYVYKQKSHIYDHVADQKMLQIKAYAIHCQNCRLKSRKHIIMLLDHPHYKKRQFNVLVN